ncbi:PucR family transcriptional regulator [Pseudonocardia spinosispora]|uniref:PucR family transcriptional regulator n=1 Tax=Pseudonocardia spinosispora TaxID=103441 RepID=UPI001FDF4DCD|nr:PucR family transcriptional regulator [Pseudonocardia spinosispora]
MAIAPVAETLPVGALDRPVRWAHACELREPAAHLVGDELLMLTGVNLPSDPAEVDRYVGGVSAAGVTALGFGITPPVSTELPGELRRACVRQGMPLLVIPQSTPFIAVSRAIAMALSEIGHRDLRRVAEAREGLTTAAVHGVEELAAGLAERLFGWVCLVDARGRPVVAHGAPLPFPCEVSALLTRLRVGSGLRSAATQLIGGGYLVAQPVFPKAAESQLVVVGRAERFSGADRAVLAVGTALFGLVDPVSPTLGAALTGMLLSGEARARSVAMLLGAGPYRVLAGVPYRSGPAKSQAGYHWLCSYLGTPLVEVHDGPRFTAIASARTCIEDLLALREHGWLAVGGSPVEAHQLEGALAEVSVLRERAIGLRRPVLARSVGLDSAVDPSAAADFAARFLAPLRELDRGRSGEPLSDTLRSWLAHHGSWDRTATALGVHRNSVRRRVGQAQRALGVDLADPETRMELWFALRWSR